MLYFVNQRGMFMGEKESPIRKEGRSGVDRREFNDPNYKGPERRSGRNRREYFRIIYPLYYRPKVRISGEDYESDVMELSERGVRFRYKGSSQLSTGAEIHVNITFYDDESFQLKGELLRIEKEDVILRFSGSISLNRIMKEQTYLINNNISHM
jgi:hypothetical protein